MFVAAVNFYCMSLFLLIVETCIARQAFLYALQTSDHTDLHMGQKSVTYNVQHI